MNGRQLFGGVWALVLICSGAHVTHGVPDAPKPPDWVVVEKDAGLAVSLARVPWVSFEISQAGQTESVIRSTGAAATQKVGWPELPVHRLLFAVPPEASPTITREISTTAFHTHRIAPVGTWREDSTGIALDRKNLVTAAESGLLYPSDWASIEPWGKFRGLQLYVLKIAPLQQRLRTSDLLEHTNISIDIAWSGGGRSGPPVEERYRPLLRHMLINPGQAEGMGTVLSSLNVNEGWDLPYPGLKITAPPGRPVVLTGDLINDHAPELAGRDVDQLSLYWKGELLPGIVEADENNTVDRLIFVSPPLPEEYENETYSNSFWLGAGNGFSIMTTRTGAPSGGPAALQSVHPVMATYAKEIEHSSYEPSGDALSWWWWRLETRNKDQVETAYLPFRMGEVDKTQPLSVTLEGKAETFDSHRIRMKLTGIEVIDTTWTDSGAFSITADLPPDQLYLGTNLLAVELIGTRWEQEVVWIKGFTLNFFTSRATEDSLLFSSQDSAEGPTRFVVDNFAESDIVVLDVSSPTAPVRLQGADIEPSAGGVERYSVSFHDSLGEGQPRSYLVFSPSRSSSAPSVQYRGSSDLTDADGADYLALSHPLFLDQASRLAAYRASTGYQTLTLDVEELFDRFSYGYPTSQAVKDFVTWAYETFDPRPGFVVLFGDGSARLRNDNETSPNFFPDRLRGRAADDNDYVNIDNDPHQLPDLAIGRLSVQTSEQAEDFVDKIIAAETTAVPSESHARYVMFADDSGGVPSQPGFAYDCEAIIERISPAYAPERIYLSYNGGSNDARNNREEMLASRVKCEQYYRPWIINALREGRLLLTYVGHGGVNTWATEWVITTDDAYEFLTAPNYPLITNFSCDTGRFDDPDYDIIMSEHFTRWREGALAYFSASRATYASDNSVLSGNLHAALLQDGIREIGLAVQAAKLQTDLEYQCRTYTLIGDPASVLPAAPLGDMELSLSPTVVSPGVTVAGEVVWPGQTVASGTMALLDGHGIPLATDEWSTLVLPASFDNLATPEAPPPGTGVWRLYLAAGADEAVGYTEFTSPANVDTGLVTPESGTGGLIASRDGNLLVMIPPWAVTTATTLRIRSYAVNGAARRGGMDFAPLPGAGQGYSYIVTLDDDQVLAAPAEISMAYDSNWLLPADADSLKIAHWNDELNAYVAVGGTLTNGRLSVASSSLGEFTLLVIYDTSPPIVTRTEIFRNGAWGFFQDGEFVQAGDQLRVSLADHDGLLGSSVTAAIEGTTIPVVFDYVGSAIEEGRLTLEIPDRAAGTHRLVVQSSDIYGNQGASTITLRSGSGLQIAGLTAIPSPFESSTHIRFVLSEAAGEAQARIYTVSGRLIRTLSHGVVNQGTNLLPWDGRDEDGDRIAGGVYFLRLDVSGENGRASAQTKVVKRAS